MSHCGDDDDDCLVHSFVRILEDDGQGKEWVTASHTRLFLHGMELSMLWPVVVIVLSPIIIPQTSPPSPILIV